MKQGEMVGWRFCGAHPDDPGQGHAQALPEDELHQIARPRADRGLDAEFLSRWAT
jgi:hypothetical protein